MGKAKVYNYVPGDNPFADRGNEGFIITNIDLGYAKEEHTVGDDSFDGKKHEVYWFRPKVEDHDSIESLSEECQGQYGSDGTLQAIIDAGIAQFTTRPNYKAAAEDKPDELAKHEAAQGLATDYQVGRRTQAGPGVKKKAQAFDALEKEAAELGMSMDDILAKIRSGEMG